MNFYYPNALWLLIILIPILINVFKKPRKKVAILNPIFEFLNKKNKKNITLKITEIIKKLLLIIITILLIIIIARPQNNYEEEQTSKKGIDIIVALDISESMLADDLKPNRINAAKEVIIDFIKKLTSDRVGIVVFAGKPFTQSPLTFDYNIITQYLNELSTKTINQNVRGLSGTAIGDAILSGITKLEKNKDRSKVIILLTDGEANTGIDPIVASQMAKEKNIKIYTIGIGQKNGYPLQYIDTRGQKRNYTDRSGKPVLTYLDEKTLKEISNISNGKYFIASNNSKLNEIFNEINKLEKTKIEINNITKYKEAYSIYAYVTILLFIAYLALEYNKPKFS